MREPLLNVQLHQLIQQLRMFLFVLVHKALLVYQVWRARRAGRAGRACMTPGVPGVPHAPCTNKMKKGDFASYYGLVFIKRTSLVFEFG